MREDIDQESVDVVIDKGTLDSVLVRLMLFSADPIRVRTARRCLGRYFGC